MVEAAGIDLLNLLLVLTLVWIFGLLVERFGYPALMGEILAGILFGPALLGLLHPSEPLDIFAELGAFLLSIYVAWKSTFTTCLSSDPRRRSHAHDYPKNRREVRAKLETY